MCKLNTANLQERVLAAVAGVLAVVFVDSVVANFVVAVLVVVIVAAAVVAVVIVAVAVVAVVVVIVVVAIVAVAVVVIVARSGEMAVRTVVLRLVAGRFAWLAGQVVAAKLLADFAGV
jgi:hypothetical protein